MAGLAGPSRDKEIGCLNRIIPVASREDVVEGSFFFAYAAAERYCGKCKFKRNKD